MADSSSLPLSTTPRSRVVRSLARAAERPCARPSCPAPARATLSFSYATAEAHLDRLSDAADPQRYDLCARHAARTEPPRGWDLVDRRPDEDRVELDPPPITSRELRRPRRHRQGRTTSAGWSASSSTPSLAHDLGAAAAGVLAPVGLVVGRDMRPSSPGLVDAFVEGVTGQGVDVVDIGLASTDQLYFASGVLDAPARCSPRATTPPPTTASSSAGGCRPGRDRHRARRDPRPRAGRRRSSPVGGAAGHAAHEDVLGRFAAHVRSFVDVDAAPGPGRRRRRQRHGRARLAGGRRGPADRDHPAVLRARRQLPEPPGQPARPRQPRRPAGAVRDGGHALGLAFDGDADRVFAVDETGRPVSSSLVGAVVADRLLRQHPGATVLHNLICSRGSSPRPSRPRVGTAVRTRVGHSFIKRGWPRPTRSTPSSTRGTLLPDNFRADSGLIAALVLLEAVAAPTRRSPRWSRPTTATRPPARSTSRSPTRRRRSRPSRSASPTGQQSTARTA
jgi:phosphomannomutase